MAALLDENSHLRAADAHLRTAVYLISAQEDRLARYRAAGLDTELPGELLLTMHAILRTFIAHRHAIQEAIEAERRSSRTNAEAPPPQGISSPEKQSWTTRARPKAAIDLSGA